MNSTRNRSMTIAAVAMSAMLLGGCAATAVSLSKKDLDVQTKTSTAIFVDAVPRPMRTVYVDVRSAVAEFDRKSFSRYVKTQFAGNEDGYAIVDDPDKAHFQMLVYVLSLEKASPDAAHAALSQGYVGTEAAAGAAVGAAIGADRGRYGWYGRGAANGAVAGGVLGSAGSLIGNSLVHDVTYMLVADVSIKERTAKGVTGRKDSQTDTKTSDAGSSQQRFSEVVDKKEYRTRIVTTANKANLDLAEAQETMFNKTAYAMSSFF